MNKKKAMERRPLKRHNAKGTIKDQLRSISPGDKREWPLADVNVNSFRTKVGEMNVEAGYSKYGIKTYPDYGTMVVTCYG